MKAPSPGAEGMNHRETGEEGQGSESNSMGEDWVKTILTQKPRLLQTIVTVVAVKCSAYEET